MKNNEEMELHRRPHCTYKTHAELDIVDVQFTVSAVTKEKRTEVGSKVWPSNIVHKL